MHKWISVADSLPEIIENAPGSGTGSSDPVLVWIEDGDSSGVQCWRLFRGGNGDTHSLHWDWDANVTHWMPIPPPPEGRPTADPLDAEE